MMDLYCLPEYDTPEEFFALKAQRQGKFGKGGRKDINAAARGLIEDWNRLEILNNFLKKVVKFSFTINFTKVFRSCY